MEDLQEPDDALHEMVVARDESVTELNQGENASTATAAARERGYAKRIGTVAEEKRRQNLEDGHHGTEAEVDSDEEAMRQKLGRTLQVSRFTHRQRHRKPGEEGLDSSKVGLCARLDEAVFSIREGEAAIVLGVSNGASASGVIETCA